MWKYCHSLLVLFWVFYFYFFKFCQVDSRGGYHKIFYVRSVLRVGVSQNEKPSGMFSYNWFNTWLIPKKIPGPHLYIYIGVLSRQLGWPKSCKFVPNICAYPRVCKFGKLHVKFLTLGKHKMYPKSYVFWHPSKNMIIAT
jgi:hypothetical protein